MLHPTMFRSVSCAFFFSDGHPRIVLSKALTSTYKAGFVDCHWSPGSHLSPAYPSLRNTPSGCPHSRVSKCQCLDTPPPSHSIIWPVSWRLRTCRRTSGRSLWFQGNIATGCWDATHNGSLGCNWTSVTTQVCGSFGFYGRLLKYCRFMSTPMGFRFLYDAGYIDREIEAWFNVGVYSSDNRTLNNFQKGA